MRRYLLDTNSVGHFIFRSHGIVDSRHRLELGWLHGCHHGHRPRSRGRTCGGKLGAVISLLRRRISRKHSVPLAHGLLLIPMTRIVASDPRPRWGLVTFLEDANMKEHTISLPELALIGGTRGILGMGLGLLLADRLNDEQRRAVGWALFLVGALSTIPLAIEVLGKRPAPPPPLNLAAPE
jgi:hypothetical protein